MPDRPRILAFIGDAGPDSLPRPLSEGCAVETVATLQDGLASLQSESYDGIFASAKDPRVVQRLRSILQTGTMLEVVSDGVALIDVEFRILWANATFEYWCGGPVVGKDFLDALGAAGGAGRSPFENALKGFATRAHLQGRDNRIYEMRITPLLDRGACVQQLVTLCHDITSQVNQQRLLDALHQAGDQLASLDPQQLSEMDVEARVELLKYNIRKLIHDLLHYDVIEIRLLNQDTGKLEPLLSEGMTTEAAQRVLYASIEGNGVTGYVAATGKSYICRDASCDPYYIKGAEGARSSLTVAIKWNNKVIGTFNVESPTLDGFTEQDVQFTEIFCRELGSALHTLELLMVQTRATATQSIEAVSREVALPVDDILNAATGILDRWIGHEPEMEEKLRVVLDRARSIKMTIQKVGEDMTVPAKPGSAITQEIPGRLRGKRILVVDNEDRVRRSAHSLLGRLGCVVETARDGKEAVTMAKLSPYDAMLADIRLPDMSGYDVYKNLRQSQPAARVILMTAYGYDPSHSLVKARQDGLKFVLYKPFRVEQMLQALETPD